MKKSFMAVYSSIEYYPPSLNALTNLSIIFDKISILSRNVKPLQWQYANHIENIQSGKFTDIRQTEVNPLHKKIFSFLLFTWNMLLVLRKNKPDLVILYDTLPTLSYYLVKNFIGYKPLLWYHNHDVVEEQLLKPYTIIWAAWKAEKKLFKDIDIFSLPAEVRKKYFPLHKLKGEYHFIPNLPSKIFYTQFYQPKKSPDTCINLLYQGTISEGHGLKTIITKVIGKKIANKTITLTLIGLCTETYKQTLLDLAKQANVGQYLFIQGAFPYNNLPAQTIKYDIGLAIHEPVNVNFITAGTASNKIYEYAALGLPVVLYDNIHYKESLGKYTWATFTNLSEQSLFECIEKIISDYENISAQAHKDFIDKLNFETYFLPVIEEVKQKLAIGS
jgi:glycosyltransferase involved in cell wall biosynthesis